MCDNAEIGTNASSSEERARAIFGARADMYTTSVPHTDQQVLGRLVEIAGPKAEWRVLDIRTKNGHTALAFSPHVREVVGLDSTEEMLREAWTPTQERKIENVTDDMNGGGIMRTQSGRALLPAAFLMVILGICAVTALGFTRDQLISDARQLAAIIEEAHPDPFLRCGGRIAFCRQLDDVLNAIPETGMTRDGFIRLIRPLVAIVGDSHTAIWDSYRVSGSRPGGIPLRFGIVEQSLYVAGVNDAADRRLYGAILISVEGVPVAELIERQRRLAACENVYDVLEELATNTLWHAPYLKDLLPEWTDSMRVMVELRLPMGEVETVSYAVPTLVRRTLRPATQAPVPSVGQSGFGTFFIDPLGAGKEIAYIRIDHQGGFREFLEENSSAGANDTTPEERARVASATEAFRDLTLAMVEAETETLVVDLRFDTGGTDTMSDILVYFLYGLDGLATYRTDWYSHGGFSAMRYSAQHFLICANQTIDQINEGRAGVPLRVGDYDFEDYAEAGDALLAEIEAIGATAAFADDYAGASTFYAEFVTGAGAGTYCPPNVLVLVSPTTFSSGSTTMKALSLNGATLVGTPSGQSCRAFGNGTMWELDHTKIQGSVSRSYFDPYPNDPARGEVWPVDVPLTYEYLAATGFDRNAELLLALEWLEARN